METRSEKLDRVEKAFLKLESHVRSEDYRGYDPYDALTGFFPFSKLGKWPPILAIQMGKRFPINLRPMLGIPKMHNPKALGLFLNGYALLPPNPERQDRCRYLFERLMELRSTGVSGLAWGYPFPWASPAKFLPAWSPTGVVTGFVALGIEAYYRTYKDERALGALVDVCRFLSQDLHHIDREGEYAISYSNVEPDFCYNASLLAAQAYALTYSHTRKDEYADRAARALTTVLSRQHPDGRWDYSEDLKTGRRRVQTDFHQGFILDSILSISESLGERSPDVSTALSNGFDFYRRHQFASGGRALWRFPKSYPADIHHQAQGILTAVRIHRSTGGSDALDMAEKTTEYALRHFQSSKGGFYYHRHRFLTDRTEYMRWGNAWMFAALAEMAKLLSDESPTSPIKRQKAPSAKAAAMR